MGTRSLSSTQLKFSMTSSIVNTLSDSATTSARSSASAPIQFSLTDTVSNGVQAGEATRAWQYKNQTISSGGSTVIDLYDFGSIDVGAGAGLDALGQSLALLEIVAIIIKNENANTVDYELEIEPDSSNGWTPIGSHTNESSGNGGALRGQGLLVKYQPSESGFLVTDASSHRISLSAVGGDVVFSIWVLGRHDGDDSSSSLSSSSLSSSSQSSSSSYSSSSSSSSSSQSA